MADDDNKPHVERVRLDVSAPADQLRGPDSGLAIAIRQLRTIRSLQQQVERGYANMASSARRVSMPGKVEEHPAARAARSSGGGGSGSGGSSGDGSSSNARLVSEKFDKNENLSERVESLDAYNRELQRTVFLEDEAGAITEETTKRVRHQLGAQAQMQDDVNKAKTAFYQSQERIISSTADEEKRVRQLADEYRRLSNAIQGSVSAHAGNIPEEKLEARRVQAARADAEAQKLYAKADAIAQKTRSDAEKKAADEADKLANQIADARERRRREGRDSQNQSGRFSETIQKNKAAEKAAAEQQEAQEAELRRRESVRQAKRDNEARRIKREREEERAKAQREEAERRRRESVDNAERSNEASRKRRARSERYEDLNAKVGSLPQADQDRLRGKSADFIERELKKMNEASRQTNRLIGRNMIDNVKHVTAWAASVGVLYSGLSLVNHSLHQMSVLGFQTARLQQVFRGNSAEANRLSEDVVRLAAATGRSSHEAMESAIQWSRMGLSRAQASEAVRVSLQAANVAEISAAEATDHLSSLTRVYNLRVSELAGVLGELNSVSNTYNVTNKDMLEGLTRTASLAKQAGIPLAELIGLIGAGVGGTGQTGGNLGNALKSVMGALNAPDKQKFLRNEFKFEVTENGSIKNMSKLLSELFVTYTNLNEAQRQNMVFGVAGKLQASRLTALLDGYVRSQVLAISAQLNLNSAEKENAKITATLQSQLAGLSAEWDLFVKKQGDRGPMTALTEITKALHNLLRLANTNVGSGVATGFLALVTALTAKIVYMGATMEAGGKKATIMQSSLAAIRRELVFLSQVMSKISQNSSIGIFGKWDKMAGNMFSAGRAAKTAAEGFRATGNAAAAAGAQLRFFALTLSGVVVRAVTAALAALAEFIIPLLAIAALIWGFNASMDAMGVTGNKTADAMSRLADEAQRAGDASKAAAMAARLFKTVGETIKNPASTHADREKNLRDVAEAAFPVTGDDTEAQEARKHAQTAELQKQLIAMSKANDIVGLGAKLEELRTRAIIQQGRKRQEEFELLSKRDAEARARIQEIQNGSFFEGGFTKKSRDKEINRLKNELSGSADKRIQGILDDETTNADDMERHKATDERHLAFLEKQKTIIQAISDIYAQMPGDTKIDQLNKEVLKQEMILELLEKQQAADKERLQQAQKAPDSPTKLLSQAESHRKMASAQSEEIRRRALQMLQGGGTVLDAEKNPFLNAVIKGPIPNSKTGLESKFVGDPEDYLAAGEDNPVAEAWKAKLRSDEEIATLIKKHAENARKAQELEDAAAKVQAQGNKTGESEMAINARMRDRQNEIDRQKAELEGKGNALNYTMAELQDRRSSAVRFAKADESREAVGADGAEQSVNQIKGVQDLIEKKNDALETGKMLGADEMHLDRLRMEILQHQVSLSEMKLSAEEKLISLERDGLNLQKEKTREYQKMLLQAGPAELLRKLAVNQLTGNGKKQLSAGVFFAMSTEARGDYMNSPGGSLDIRENRRQQDEMRKAGVGGNRDKVVQSSIDAAKSRAEMQSMLGTAPMELAKSAVDASDRLSVLAKTASKLDDALAAMEARVNAYFTPKNANSFGTTRPPAQSPTK